MGEVQQLLHTWQNDLSVGLKLREIRNFNVESLSDNSSVCTAIANDIGYENIFYAQLKK